MDPSPDSPSRDSPMRTPRPRAGTAANWLPFGFIGLGFLLLLGGAAIFSYDLSTRLGSVLAQLDRARTADERGRDLLGGIDELQWRRERLRLSSGPVATAGYLGQLDDLRQHLQTLRAGLDDPAQRQAADHATALLVRERAAAIAASDSAELPPPPAPALHEAFATLAGDLRQAQQALQDLAQRLTETRTLSVYITLALIGALGLLTMLLGLRHFEALRTQEQLRAEVARSRRQNEDKSRFLTQVSHEIRTPMNAIFGYAGLLHGRLQDPQQRRCVESITSSARALLTMIDELLDLSKIEAGHLELDRRPTQLRDVVDGVIDLLAGQAADRGVALRSELPSPPPALLLDGERLRQMLVNLVGNALKHTTQGEVCVRATLRPRPDGAHGDCRIEVSDTGSGIAAADLDAIFEPYRQSGQGGQSAHGGTGLGLFITRQIARTMGGEVGVSSTPGSGSVFRIDLPAVPLLPVTAASQTAAVASAPLLPAVVLPRLDSLLREAWPRLRDSLTLGEARQFAAELTALAERGGGAQLQHYAQRLRGAVEDFDVAAIERLLAEYPAEVLALRRLARQETADAA